MDYTQDANCVGAWLFTEGSGTTVADSSPNTNTGTFTDTNKPTWDATDVPYATSGAAPNSVDFSSADHRISVGSDASLDNMTKYTFVTLVSEEGAGGNNNGRVFDKNNRRIFLGDVSNTIQAEIDYGTTNANSLSASNAYSNTTIFSLQVTWDGTGDRYARIYVNTTEVNYGTFQAGGASPDGIGDDSASNYVIGNHPTVDRHLNGKVTETAIFTRILSSTERNEIYDFGLVGTGAVAATGFMTTNTGYWGT